MAEFKILEQTETGEVEAPRTSKWLTCVIEIVILALCLALALILRISVYEPAYIPSASMENTLLVGDRVLIDRRASLHGTWKRGDIVIFEAEGNWGSEQSLVKRIIGLPGESVEVRQGQVYLDGGALAENYLKEAPAPQDFNPIVLKAGEYYVMGDNRNRSDDSRYNGPVREEQIRGRAVSILYPLTRAGRLTRPDYGP